jgi:Uma2 family endonuclease
MIETADSVERQPWMVHLAPLKVTAEQFRKVCQSNPDWRFELTAEGDLIIMPPTGAETGATGGRLTTQLTDWADRDRTGVAFDSSTGFILPNGAIRSPDAAWVARARLAKLTRRQRQGFLPLCPDFVVDLKSPSDALPVLQAKMREYMANGSRLGWLIDPQHRTVYAYRPRAAVRRLENPATVSGDPVLPGFVLNVAPIWEPDL